MKSKQSLVLIKVEIFSSILLQRESLKPYMVSKYNSIFLIHKHQTILMQDVALDYGLVVVSLLIFIFEVP